jgi:hypothetical protein
MTDFSSFFNFFRKPITSNGYKKFSTKIEPNPDFESLKQKNLQILVFKGVNSDKVRFTGVPYFTYDFVKDEINPELIIDVPMMPNGLFDTSREKIIVGPDERSNRAFVGASVYENPDWNTLVDNINNSNRGYVFYLSDSKETHYEIDTNRIRYVDLDTI